MPPHTPEVWDIGDDWTGIACAKERRKRQNRLHQRAYRKRKHLMKTFFHSSKPDLRNEDTPDAPPNIHAIIERSASANTRQHQSLLYIAVLDKLPLLAMVKCPELQESIAQFLQRAFTNWGLNAPSPCDLPAVTRINTFDALARNALALQIPTEYLESDNHNSLFNRLGPQLPGVQQLTFPTHLLPTQLQRVVPHHPWLDLFPIPGMRDNILRGIETGRYDEDALCDALCCELLDLDAGTTASFVVWGESWDARGWEFSPAFFRQWGELLRGCPEALQTTNYWREKRGEMKIDYMLN